LRAPPDLVLGCGGTAPAGPAMPALASLGAAASLGAFAPPFGPLGAGAPACPTTE